MSTPPLPRHVPIASGAPGGPTSLADILAYAEGRHSQAGQTNHKLPLEELGFISCGNTVNVRHVPFYDPCLILVLAGRKVMFDQGEAVTCDPGGMLAVPPASYDLRNEPDPRLHKYRALIIPFTLEQLEKVQQMHSLEAAVAGSRPAIFRFGQDATLLAAVRHYLDAAGQPRLREHRLMEILLILASRDARLPALVRAHQSWSQRVRAVLSADISRAWALGEVCRALATSESTLRRHLAREETGFREMLNELRLSAALGKLLQTSLPVYRIAGDCGYQSVSRFTSNFHKRFGLPPRAFRENLSDSEQKLTVS